MYWYSKVEEENVAVPKIMIWRYGISRENFFKSVPFSHFAVTTHMRKRQMIYESGENPSSANDGVKEPH